MSQAGTPHEQPRTRMGWPVYAWGLWDWGSAAFNAVITTFVFSVYITNKEFFGDDASTRLGWALALAGVVVLLIAPVSGQRADRSGRRTFWLAVNTGLVVVISAALFFVKPEQDYLWLGLALLAAGNIVFELAQVNYNAMLNDISTPRNVGRVSGLGWGLGYVGGIVLLLFVYFGLINPEEGLFGVSDENAIDVRVTMLICAVWTVIFSIPLVLTFKDDKSLRGNREPRVSLLTSYKLLFGTIARLWRHDRNTALFLLASAVFRDGLAGVFAFGGVLAANVFGFSAGDVIIFAVAANLVAGVATIAFGRLDDLIGPKRVIVLSLVSMIVAGTGVFLLHDLGATMFWILGLTLCIFVGPAQSASRTFLSRLIPEGEEGEFFGLYATTGRMVSFMAPSLFATFIVIGAAVEGTTKAQAEHWGILGIVLVLLIGLLLVLKVKSAVNEDSALTAPPTTAV